MESQKELWMFNFSKKKKKGKLGRTRHASAVLICYKEDRELLFFVFIGERISLFISKSFILEKKKNLKM